MRSRTKVTLRREELESLVHHAFGSSSRVRSAEELTDGMFNAAYALELEGQAPVVLKVAPPPGQPLLTYERDLMRTEVEFYERVAKETTCPVPRVLAHDFSRSRIGSDYFFMERLRGAPLEKMKKELTDGERARLQAELGELVGRLGAIRGRFFGYPQHGTGTQAATWREAFLAMVDRLLQDAERLEVRLPLPTREILALFQAGARVLEQVKEPVLTHFDLWDGNVFVHRVEGVPRIEALIDGERAFWGDPIAELVSTALFRDAEQEQDFLRGYQEATGTPLVFTEGVRHRLNLYRAYLCLIMVIEGVPRGYSGLKYMAIRQYCLFKLRGELKQLAARGRG
ncbi:aminoglycoside phosphotransferase family protein [Archangium violaceum]|uniref:phosphotransferase family protein n=1 Tax=Archangium violaceum TaxID=83451 RepID=UPI00193B5C85|nr:aminoglycoside phosphotransferase family protein [Archangium violaceum]QRK07431.1 aminoglycoside phosphotransferase family protein [Archangium violaceum]